jgi:hypothetical protein
MSNNNFVTEINTSGRGNWSNVKKVVRVLKLEVCGTILLV